ncbi:Protein aurora borealis [Collichthys lucidus]|uniref:Protein aurora borealis n=1 Tax=Collichthys lucidus TaxID=240159 RepID=A0A4U5VCE3_COLLU|nr:Protein aurora borealis [Collichthys lucidus]
MGDHVEVQITPETPGRPSIRNPFESPNDYHHLREALVPSPSVFKSKSCKATPPKFNWSIDEMASLLPVHIDPEEIQRQSFYLSQTRMDSDIEEKRQNAIEQFFTKGAIVPSPWAAPDARKGPQMSMKSCMSAMITEEPVKISVACQTTLSLPLAFDLEKVLGDYYRHEEPCDAVQESLSSSSLRRKLFLDGRGSYSGSDSSSPPSPERGHAKQERPSLTQKEGAVEGVEAISSIFCSPLSCGALAPTPSTVSEVYGCK